MSKHVWTVLCRQTSIDETSKTLSLFGVLEELAFIPDRLVPDGWSSLQFPAVLVTFLVRTEPSTAERSRIKIEVIGPNNEIFEHAVEGDVDLVAHARIRIIFNLETTPFRGFGIHRFVVSLADQGNSWLQVADVPLEIKLKGDTQAAVPTKQERPRKTARAKPKSKS